MKAVARTWALALLISGALHAALLLPHTGAQRPGAALSTPAPGLARFTAHAVRLTPGGSAGQPQPPQSPQVPRPAPALAPVNRPAAAPPPPPPAREVFAPSGPAAPPSAQGEALSLQAAQPPASGRWHFSLQMAQGEGEGTLVWEQDGSQYRLHLTRTSGQRNLPSWHSEGRLVAGGLQPLRFTVQRGPRRQETVDFQPDEGLAHFSSLGATQAVPALTQDRLSWIVQLVALAQAAPAGGAVLRMGVVGWRGGQRVLVFRRQALGPDDPPHWQRWRGEHEPADGFEVEAWLDPTHNHWPQRLRQTFEGEPRTEWRDGQAAPL